MDAPSADYDSPWKEALEHYFPEFLALLQPSLHQQIDWAYPPVFLDKELQAITRDAANGRRYADKLVLVHLRRNRGRDLLLLVHIEVQGGRVTPVTLARMGERMYRYFYRLSDHYLQSNDADEANLFSLCVFTAGADGPPAVTYTQGFEGCRVQFSCPVVHLAKWLVHWGELELKAERNPFAVIVMAQLLAQQTHPDSAERLASKTRIVRLLYQYKYSRKDALQLLRLIDWLMQLSANLEPLFDRAVETIEQENKMAFVTSFERRSEQRGLERGLAKGMEKGIEKGMEKGMEKGKLEGQATLLQRLLDRKFGSVPQTLQQRIQTATPVQLETWSLNILDAATLDEVFTD